MGVSLTLIHGYESKPYSGPLRPFINWGEGLLKMSPSSDVSLILYKSDPKIIESLPPKLSERTMLINNAKKLLRIIRDLKPEIIISDDDFHRLKLLERLKEFVSSKTIIYVQFLYGIHTISDIFHYDLVPLKKRVLYKASRITPYKIVVSRYVKMLKKQNVFIANSNTSKNFFYWLYNIRVSDIIYPSINTNVFKPYKRNADFSEVLVYLGSSGGDLDLDFVHRIIKTVIKRGFKVNLLGNERTAKIIVKNFDKKEVEYHSDLSDVELAKLYSRASVTVCPQTWELFGYTAVESMACGTPVLAFNYFGHSETIIDGKTGFLANTEDSFIKKLELTLNGYVEFDHRYIREYATERFSTERSTKKLMELIKMVYNHEVKKRS